MPEYKMVQLYLHKPASNETGDRNAVKDRLSLLQRLESIIWSMLTSGGRYEARIWLCNTISCIHSITPYDQHDLFLELLRSKLSRQDVAAQLLQLIFEKRAGKVGPIIAKRSHMLEKFFEGNPKRILQWFDNFAVDSELSHKKGARAISQFAFVNRDSCWEELEWRGKHGQAPAIVATKPHYFQDLDVLKTVENFLEYVPDFWSSDELAESVKGGEILYIDTKYFVEQFLRLMYEVNLEDIWAVIGEFIMEEQFSFLSKHLLILLDEDRFLAFLKSISRIIRADTRCRDFAYPSCWLENLLLTSNDFISLDELILSNAVIVQARQLRHFLGDEEHVESKIRLEKLLGAASTFSNTDHWALMKECVEMKRHVAVKWIALQSWVVHYYLSTECRTPQSWESLFGTNKISFRKADEYSLVGSDEILVGYSSDDDDDVASNSHKKRKRDRKKRRIKKYSRLKESDEMLEFQKSDGQQSFHTGRSSWLLSTDGYSCGWDSTDLPEHLSKHCFSTWMKWVFSKW